MPKLWEESIATHRLAVREAILEATWTLVHERGLAAVSMASIAEQVGIGRATLYRHFPDVEDILVAWHSTKIEDHLGQLRLVAERTTDPAQRLHDVLAAYQEIAQEVPHGTELAALMHQGPHLIRAEQQVAELVRDVIAAAADTGAVRTDTAPAELAAYCLHALAGSTESIDARRRLLSIVLAGLRS